MIRIGDGPVLKYTRGSKKQPAAEAMQDPRVPQLRTKLGVTENPDDNHYDAKVAEAVQRFQESVDIKANGVLDERTVNALNSPKRDKQVDTVLVNMERWRWLPRDPRRAFDRRRLCHPQRSRLYAESDAARRPSLDHPRGRGQARHPRHPASDRDDEVHHGQTRPGTCRHRSSTTSTCRRCSRIRPCSIAWACASSITGTDRLHISQPPGEANALGRVRFNFPNKFLVYQHDTPDKYLFAKDERAFSHGCMRVQYPDQYAAVLVEHHDAERALHAGEDPRHVRFERDRPEIPDPDPGQHHLPDRVRGRCRQAASPQRCVRSPTPP